MSWPHAGSKWVLTLGMWQESILKLYTPCQGMKLMSPPLQADNSYPAPQSETPTPGVLRENYFLTFSSLVIVAAWPWEGILISSSAFPQGFIDSALKSILKNILLLFPILNHWHSWGSFQNVSFLQMIGECHTKRHHPKLLPSPQVTSQNFFIREGTVWPLWIPSGNTVSLGAKNLRSMLVNTLAEIICSRQLPYNSGLDG